MRMVRAVLTMKRSNIIPVRGMCGAPTGRKDTRNTTLSAKMVQSVKNTDIEGVHPLINGLLFFLFPGVFQSLPIAVGVEEREVVSVMSVPRDNEQEREDEHEERAD